MSVAAVTRAGPRHGRRSPAAAPASPTRRTRTTATPARGPTPSPTRQRRRHRDRDGHRDLRRRPAGRRRRHARPWPRTAARPPSTSLANDTDVDGGPTIDRVGHPADHGTVVITGGGTGLTYRPDADYCNDARRRRHLHLHAQRRRRRRPSAITVTCVNDAPVADDETVQRRRAGRQHDARRQRPHRRRARPAGPQEDGQRRHPRRRHRRRRPGPSTVVRRAPSPPTTAARSPRGRRRLRLHPGRRHELHRHSATSSTTPSATAHPSATDTGRVTIAITDCVWYVNNNAPGNSGTSNAPFDTLAQAQTASATGHTIFVFDGDDTTTGLQRRVSTSRPARRLLGEAADLQVGARPLHTGVAGQAAD